MQSGVGEMVPADALDPVPAPFPAHGAETVADQAPSRPVAWRMVLVLCFICMFSMADQRLTFILAESIKHDLGLTDVELGLLNGMAFMGVYAIAAIPLGVMADRKSARNLLLVLVSLWSAMTALGGLAANFIQLALTRAGVALGEAGGMPAAHVLIQRGIAPRERGRALALFHLGNPVGGMLGLALGGWLNTLFGWRAVMLGAGALGVFVVLLIVIAVPDLRMKPVVHGATAPIAPTLRRLSRSMAFVWLFVAMAMLGGVSGAVFAFTPPYLMRTFGMNSAQVGIALGLTMSVTGVLGLALGGIAFDRAQKGTPGGLMLWPGISFILTGALAAWGYLAPNATMAILLLAPLGFAGNFHFPSTFGAAHIVAGPGNQAIASSVLQLSLAFLGGLTGPLIVGFISDMLLPTVGVTSVRWALLFVPLACLGAGGALLMANRHLAGVMAAHRAAEAAAAEAGAAPGASA